MLTSMEGAHFYGLRPKLVSTSKAVGRERTEIKFGDLELVIVTKKEKPHLVYFVECVNGKKLYHLPRETMQNSQNNNQDLAYGLLIDALMKIGVERVYN